MRGYHYKNSVAFKTEVNRIVRRKAAEQEIGPDGKAMFDLKREVKKEVSKRVKEGLRSIKKRYHDNISVDGWLRKGYRVKLQPIPFAKKGMENNQMIILSDELEIPLPTLQWMAGTWKPNNPTKTEERFAAQLSKTDIKHTAEQGFYIMRNIYFADFFFPDFGLVIELDGSYHLLPEQADKDALRSKFFQLASITVWRVPNTKVKTVGSCKDLIADIIKFGKNRAATWRK